MIEEEKENVSIKYAVCRDHKPIGIHEKRLKVLQFERKERELSQLKQELANV